MHRFWSKVNIAGLNDCWEWQAYKNPDGYGMFRFNKIMVLSHRMAWLLTNTEIPATMVIMHKCDNPPCVNPNHLSLGTYADNIRDRDTKGRCRSGIRKKEQTHCKNGHEFSLANTYIKPKNKTRDCKLCRNKRAEKHRKSIFNHA